MILRLSDPFIIFWKRHPAGITIVTLQDSACVGKTDSDLFYLSHVGTNTDEQQGAMDHLIFDIPPSFVASFPLGDTLSLASEAI